MTTFSEEYAWSARWTPKIQQLLIPKIVRPATLGEEYEGESDLFTLVVHGSKIACRVRRPGYQHFPDVTVTCRRETGAPCEWHKMILGGLWDWFFYAHATSDDPATGDLMPRVLIDLTHAREWMRAHPGPELGPNKDAVGRRCWFFAFDVRAIRSANPKAILAYEMAPKQKAWVSVTGRASRPAGSILEWALKQVTGSPDVDFSRLLPSEQEEVMRKTREYSRHAHGS